MKVLKEMGATERPWFDFTTWALIYGGLLSIIGALALGGDDAALATGLGMGGGLATAIGALMVYIRSRMS